MNGKMEMRVYKKNECIVFKKTDEPFGGLSNMAPGFPIVVNGVRIRTSEALYQACRFPHKPDIQRLIISQSSPMTAKMRSKPYRTESRPDWNRARINIMRWCLRVKLAQNWQQFSKLLLATSDKTIVEESRKDEFWGAKPQSDGTLFGHNILGRLLIELREQIRIPDGSSFKRILPLEIPDFLLFGEQIREVEANADLGAWLSKQEQLSLTEHESELDSNSPGAGSLEKISEDIESYDVSSVSDSDKSDQKNVAIPKECKRLAEVDFPIAVVSKHSAREKKIFGYHPQMLNQWWARRPLAACRAMLLALLWPDPCDPHCPQEFKDKARKVLAPLPGKVGTTDEGLRKALLKFIGDFADWDRSLDKTYIETSRTLVKAAHGDEAPLVVDPFAGGGSIPLEALRVGCEAFASDLNPVACLILKVILEDIPRHGPALAEEVRRIGVKIKTAAEKELAEFYPVDPDGTQPIAYLWARTVRCEAPNCGAEIPLMRSFWLCKKPNHRRALKNSVVRNGNNTPQVEFEVFEPKSDKEVPTGTVTRAKATCLCCNIVLQPDRVRAQLADQRGGADAIFDKDGNRIGGARLFAVVTLKPGAQGRCYRLAHYRDYEAAWKAQTHIGKIASDKLPGGLSVIPDEPTPVGGGSGAGRAFSVQKYGMLTFGDLFTARQKVALLSVLVELNKLPPSVCELLSFVATRLADKNASLVSWDSGRQTIGHVFNRQALPIVWDFVESAIPQGIDHVLNNAVSILSGVIKYVSQVDGTGQLELADATEHPLPDQAASVWFTDPPYYDAVPYADLSDFFLVWLKRSLLDHPLLSDPFDPENLLSPKKREAVQDETKQNKGQVKDRVWFEETMARAFAEGHRILRENGVGSVVFAHKTTEGWEALLSGMIRGGWTITGSWPIATERPGRLRSQDSAALATSVHLVCRPRSEDAQVGDWSEVLRELPKRVGDWMERLQKEHIRGADLVFACIGPALEIFSRYSKVETAEGTEVTLAEYLLKVWEVVGRLALEQVLGTAEAQARNGAAGALEEDARLTALFLWTLQSTNGEEEESKKEKGKRKKGEEENETEEEFDDDGEEGGSKARLKGFTLIYDVARRFAQPLGIHLPEWEGRIIETKKGIVRLMPVAERAQQLFGAEGTQAIAQRMEEGLQVNVQGMLFPDMETKRAPRVRGGGKHQITIGDEHVRPNKEATTLDRVHAAMLLQASGKSNALRALIKDELDKGSDFMRLANALSALYPKGSEEKRLVDAMLLAVPR